MLHTFILFGFVFEGQQLRVIEEDVLNHLVEQIRLHSENLSSDLEEAVAKLEAEPRDLHDLSNCALQVILYE